MIDFVEGDLLAAKAEALVNAVNCVGVMGRGIALQFAREFPWNTAIYERACKSGRLAPGRVLIVQNDRTDGPRYIVNFPTKRHWKSMSRLDDIETALTSLAADLTSLQIRSIAIPRLGCGLGGLRWGDVLPLVVATMSALPEVHTLVYAPSKTTEERNRQIINL